MSEIARQLFVTLNKENNWYYILNDGTFVCKYYAENETQGRLIFRAWLNGGYRERYAIENGIADFTGEEYKNCIAFNIPSEPLNPSNGAAYDIREERWRN